jgi:Holliday junction resolvase RusA-like endonuclease
VTRHGAYIPKGHAIHAYKQAVLLTWQSLPAVYGEPMPGAVSVGLTFWFPRPLNKIWKTKPMLAEVKTTKPDLDNLAKGVLDALQHHAFGDDSQVVELRLSKWIVRGGALPRTEITITDEAGKH